MIDMGLASMIGSLGSAALGAAGGALANYQNSQMDAKNREWNEEMWNKANLYNLPINQRERLRQAGLNENLVYGNGANTLASYAGNLSANRDAQNIFKDANLNNIVQQSLDAKRVQNETKVADAQAKKLDAEARNEEFEANLRNDNKQLFYNIVYNTSEKLYQDANVSYKQRFLIEEMTKELQYKNVYNMDFALNEYDKPIDFLIGSTDKKKYYVKCYNGDDVVFASMLADYCRKGLDLENAMQLYNKTNEEIQLTIKQQQKVDSDIAVNKSVEAVNYADAQLKQAERAYYKTMASLNTAQRDKILLEMKNNKYVVQQIVSQTNLTQAQAKKAIGELEEALRNGRAERWKKLYVEQFGTGTVGTILNAAHLFISNFGSNYYFDKDYVPRPRK